VNAMSGITDAPQPSTHRTFFTETKRCPECRSDSLVWLTQMRALDQDRDWYRCKACGNEFSIDRA
jgi:DNA-directed RNA polymerase subunit M/transcription elongation factor TFIIS